MRRGKAIPPLEEGSKIWALSHQASFRSLVQHVAWILGLWRSSITRDMQMMGNRE